MIAQFPQMYPDELFYSVLARYYVRSGHVTYRYCSDELFRNFRTPDIEYITGLSDELKRIVDLPDVILNHTMFPMNARFITAERRKNAWNSFLKGDSKYQNALYRRRGKGNEKRFLRYCPCCVREDREQFGETYWHRKHQIPGITVCPEHGCYLCDSSVEISGKVSPDLVPAATEIAEKAEPDKCRSETEVTLARYCCDVLFSPMSIDAHLDPGRFFRHRIQGTPYTTIRGRNINTQKLQADLREYYSGTSTFAFEELWQVQKIFSSYNNPVAICSLAFFLHIPASELMEMKTPNVLHHEEYDLQIKQRMNKILGSFNLPAFRIVG